MVSQKLFWFNFSNFMNFLVEMLCEEIFDCKNVSAKKLTMLLKVWECVSLNTHRNILPNTFQTVDQENKLLILTKIYLP